MKRLWNNTRQWFVELAHVTRREFSLSLTDAGILLFFIALPLFYPIVYTLIYNPEVARNIPVAVVDDCRSAQSRELVRMTGATDAIKIVGYASNMAEARRWKDRKDVYAIMHIPADFSEKVGRGEQANVSFYSDMALLLRYRSMLLNLTSVQLAAGANLRTETLSSLGASGMSMGNAPVNNVSFMLGDTEQGFASFIIPGIVILILQQSMLLGITMLGGTSFERARRNRGIDPLAIQAAPTSTVMGKMLCYVIIYLPLTLYVLHYIPTFFALPHLGSPLHYIPFVFPMLIASAFLGLTLQVLVKEREMSLMVVVFTSVILLFLSGLTWPRYAMGPLWTGIGDMIPAVWGMEGFIRINSNDATLADNSTAYTMLWVLAFFYFLTATWAVRHRRHQLSPLRH